MTMQQGDHPQFTDADEALHAIGDSPLWQESVLLHWYDRDQGVGGFHRLGHEPNNQGGRAAIWSFLFDRRGWQYRRCDEVPLQATDRYPGGFAAGDVLRFAFDRGTAHWSIADGEIEAELHCENLFDIVDPFPKSDIVAAKRFPNHFEVAGRLRGHVTRAGRRIEVAGFGYRDHSWGARDWGHGMPNHRWWTGTLGAELSFAAITAQAPTGRLTRVGYVHRRGRLLHATDVDVVVHMEPDGLTHRGGEILLTLPGDERLRIEVRSRGSVVFQRGNVVMVETISEARGAGLTGYCDAEISSNPRAGSGPVLLAINATTTSGITPFQPLAFPF